MADAEGILLIEDDPRDVELILAALAAKGADGAVTVVDDGVQALEYLQRRGRYATRRGRNPRVVILDLKMPKIDGYEVLRRLKSDETLRLIPVVVLTSSRQEADRLTCYRMNANAYVAKPVDFRALADAVGAIAHFWTRINEPPP